MSDSIRDPTVILRDHADGYHDDAVMLAESLLSDWDEWMYGRSPTVGAAAALFYAQDIAGVRGSQRVKKRDVADDFGIGESGMTDWRDRVLGDGSDDDGIEPDADPVVLAIGCDGVDDRTTELAIEILSRDDHGDPGAAAASALYHSQVLLFGSGAGRSTSVTRDSCLSKRQFAIMFCTTGDAITEWRRESQLRDIFVESRVNKGVGCPACGSRMTTENGSAFYECIKCDAGWMVTGLGFRRA